MEKKQLLNSKGEPITKEMIEQVFKEQFKDDDLGIKHYEGPGYEYWVVKTPASKGKRALSVTMNRAAYSQFNESIRKMCMDEGLITDKDEQTQKPDKE